MMDYLLRVAAWFSQGLNCVFLNGSPDQTVSARAYLNQKDKYWGYAHSGINMVFFWQKDHCRKSHEADVRFAKSILATE